VAVVVPKTDAQIAALAPVQSVAGLTGAVSSSGMKSAISLNNVTNNAQTQAAIVPNTVPTAGQLLVGNASGTAYGVVSASGDATISSTGAITVAKVNGSTLGTMSAQSSGAVSITGGSITGITDLAVADGGTGASDAATARTNLGIGSIATQESSSVSITGGTINGAAVTGLSTPSASGDAATKGYVDGIATNILHPPVDLNCSANPNYPSALKGDTYICTVAGKVGGASGTSVDIGDWIVCKADNAGGTQASVGTSWYVVERNIVGPLLASNNLSDVASASTALSNLGGQPLSTSLTNLAGMTVTGTNKIPLVTSTGTWSNTAMSSIGQNILGAATAAGVQAQAGVVIGTNVQAFSAQLTSAAAVGDGIVAHTAANTFTPRTITGTTNVITVTNGDGVAGNPTLTVGSLVQRTDTAAVLTAQQNFGATALTSSAASIAWNLATAQSASHTFTENTTLANPTNMVNGGTYVLRLTQHASSPKTLAFGSAYKWSGGAPTVSSTNGAVDIITFISDGTNMYGSILKAFA
jgi:hypothetical protein